MSEPNYKFENITVPFVGGIIERTNKGEKELLIQTRWKPDVDPDYSGTFEFPAGALDINFENIYQTLSREIEEECGLKLKAIINDSQTKTFSPGGADLSFGFRPFCCVQQLKKGRPWIGFIFLCEVESGQLKVQKSEVKDARWIKAADFKKIFINNPERIFTLELPAWEYYFNQAIN